ncbi:hypothetical protein EIP91_009623 [Steccherinum ochraceum]|uniref:NAD(P)-binding protein n=1 Tax=Steccherinum ochraceum TaxID=92696 RepID=A0A4R0R9I5_9APHY|nr:hypothetical protein EIP91_009623 [Steccherinum ochraceum]
MATKTTWLITGTSRGIGLEFVRQLATSAENVVIASCRNPDAATDLKAIVSKAKGTMHVVPLDVGDLESIKGVEKYVKDIIGDEALDYLLNNAGTHPGEADAFNISPETFITAMNTNVLGPAKLAETLLPYLERSQRPVVMNMSSGLGSFGFDLGPICAAYSVSKTALNMITYKQAKAKPNVIFFAVDPGWVKTEMGGEGAQLEPDVSVSGILKLLKSISLQQSGQYFRHDGSTSPW